MNMNQMNISKTSQNSWISNLIKPTIYLVLLIPLSLFLQLLGR